jgi:peptide/nickel transport system permease protein
MHVNVSRMLRRDPWFLTGIILTLFFLTVAFLGPLLAPFSPWNMDFVPLSPPSSAHLLGVNDGGQDILSELLYAVRNTFVFGVISASRPFFWGCCWEPLPDGSKVWRICCSCVWPMCSWPHPPS